MKIEDDIQFSLSIYYHVYFTEFPLGGAVMRLAVAGYKFLFVSSVLAISPKKAVQLVVEVTPLLHANSDSFKPEKEGPTSPPTTY